MISIDPTRFKVPPFKHQLVGVQALLNNAGFALYDEPGAGKTKQVVDAACLLWEEKEVELVVVACPAQVKIVWLDPELGEVTKHAFVPSTVIDFTGKLVKLKFPIELDRTKLTWIIASYELLRRWQSLNLLIQKIKKLKVMLVMDESIALKAPKAEQTKAVYELSLWCQRRVLLNGTPNPESMMDLYSQFRMLDHKILDCRSWHHFRARYAVMGGYQDKQVISYKNLEDLARRTKPFVLRRLKEDCLDLPPKLYSQQTVALTPETWKLYKSMRDQLVVWLGSQASMTQYAPVKAMRLSQLCSGFIGGVVDLDEEEMSLFGVEAEQSNLGFENAANLTPSSEGSGPRTEVVGSEKLKFISDWLTEQFKRDPGFRVLIWCKFRLELDRVLEAVQVLAGDNTIPAATKVYCIRGGQKKVDRAEAVTEGMIGTGPAVILGNPAAGGFALNLVSISNVVYLSCGYSLLTRLQSEDRVHRPGQAQKVLYLDVIATGPDRQKTIDHAVVAALRKKENLSKWTTDRWRSVILEE